MSRPHPGRLALALMVLVLGGVWLTLRPPVYQAQTMVETTAAEAGERVVPEVEHVDGPGFATAVTKRLEVSDDAAQRLRLDSRVDHERVTLRASAADPRLAAAAADVAALEVTESSPGLELGEAAQVPVDPVGPPRAVWLALAAALSGAILLLAPRRRPEPAGRHRRARQRP